MKILLYTKAFHPMLGGIETVAETLAELFTKLGHECSVVTPVENSEPDSFIYPVRRHPGFFQKVKLVLRSEIVMSNGASLAMVPYCLLLAKPFVWVHAGYQASCVDGLGWVDGKPAPLTPKASIAFHYRKSGLFYASKEAFKLFVRRFVCKHIVAMNVAVSDWVELRQPFKKQIRIHNPFPLYRFANGSAPGSKPLYDFLYLGRLVSEKGVGTLIKALALVQQRNPKARPKLLIVGEGNWRGQLESMTKEAGLENSVVFAGRKTGGDLLELIDRCQIAVVPSEWEEPMGGVALELLAAGKPLIVSRNGGLAECAGDAALVFDNGDHEMLADCMTRLLEDETLRASLRRRAETQLKQFDPETLARQYIDLFNYVLGKRELPRSEDSAAQPSGRKAESIN